MENGREEEKELMRGCDGRGVSFEGVAFTEGQPPSVSKSFETVNEIQLADIIMARTL